MMKKKPGAAFAARRVATAVAATGALMGLAACGSHPMRVALTELGTTSSSEYGAYHLRMMRAVNITGLGPEEVVGSVSSDPDKWSVGEQLARFMPERDDFPDIMAPRLTDGPTQLVVRQFCLPEEPIQQDAPLCRRTGNDKERVTLEDLTSLRNNIQFYQVRIAEVAQLELKVNALNAASQGMVGATDERKAVIRKGLAQAYPSEKFADQADFDATVALANQALTAGDLSKELQRMRNILAKPGVVVTNWSRDVDTSASASAGSAASAGLGGNRKIRGFLILGEPRVSSLQFGTDLIERRDIQRTTMADPIFRTHRNYMTHYQLRARYVVFAETLESALTARLDADVAALVKLLRPIFGANFEVAALAPIKLSVQAQFAAITAVSESGVLDGALGFVQSQNATLAPGKMSWVATEMASAAGTLPIISIRANVDEVLRMAEERHLKFCLRQENKLLPECLLAKSSN